jgi:hypothetical protein
MLHSAQLRAFRWLYPLLFLFASLTLLSAKQLRRPKSSWLMGCLLALLVAPLLAYQPARAFGKRLLGMESRRELQAESIAALTSRINASVEEEVLFLIDPRLGRFRGLTGQCVVVTYRDATTGRALGPEALRLWGERYSEVSALYKDPSPEGFLALAEKYRVDYIVTEGTALKLPLVVSEGVFRVYDARNSVLMKDGVGGLGGQHPVYLEHVGELEEDVLRVAARGAAEVRGPIHGLLVAALALEVESVLHAAAVAVEVDAVERIHFSLSTLWGRVAFIWRPWPPNPLSDPGGDF